MEIAARPSMSSSWMKKKERISVSRLMEKLFCMLLLPLHDSCWIRESLSNDKYRDSKACFRPYCHASWNIHQAKRHSLVTQGYLWSSLCYSSTSQGWRTADESVVVSIVFFTGKLEKLLYLTSHLFLAFLLPNYIKSCVWKKPWLFEVVKTVVRWVVSLLYGIIWLVTFGKDLDFITAIIEYNPSQTGKYDKSSDNLISLGWFEDNQDSEVAQTEDSR
jgi:hypothetical protein